MTEANFGINTDGLQQEVAAVEKDRKRTAEWKLLGLINNSLKTESFVTPDILKGHLVVTPHYVGEAMIYEDAYADKNYRSAFDIRRGYDSTFVGLVCLKMSKAHSSSVNIEGLILDDFGIGYVEGELWKDKGVCDEGIRFNRYDFRKSRISSHFTEYRCELIETPPKLFSGKMTGELEGFVTLQEDDKKLWGHYSDLEKYYDSFIDKISGVKVV